MGDVKGILARLRQQNIEVGLSGQDIELSYDGDHVPDALIDEIRDNKEAIIAFLKKYGQEQAGRSIPAAPAQDAYELSSAQKRLWILHQLDQDSIAYNLGTTYLFKGALSVAALSAAVNALVGRHEILRTLIREGVAGPEQIILPEPDPSFLLPVLDLRDVAGREGKIREAIDRAHRSPFDLAKGPLLRTRLLRTADDEWLFVLAMHHIISDGWSTTLMIRELLQLYRAAASGANADLPPLRIQYKDYAAWQHDNLRAGAFDASRDYWKKQFADDVPVLQLPLDKPRPAIRTTNSGVVRRRINADLTARLQLLSQEEGATLFMSMIALVNLLLVKYSGQNDIVIGTPIANREHPDLEHQLGFYINTLALRIGTDEAQDFRQLLKKVSGTTIDAYEHQSYPFDELVADLGLRRDLSRSVLFDVMVVQQALEIGSAPVEQLGDDLTVSEYPAADAPAGKFDLTFNFWEGRDGLELFLEYNADLFHAATMERLLRHFERLAHLAVTTPALPVAGLSLVTDSERTQLLEQFNDTAFPHPTGKTLDQLFAEQAARTPDAVALIFRGEELTYRQLDERSNQVARYLRDRCGVREGALVPICLDRSFDMLIGILGILKAGAAYVPIDPAYPAGRITYMLDDADATVVLTDERSRGAIPSACTATIVRLDGDRDPINEESTDALSITADATRVAYCIYTSGSTGRPKGVMNQHDGVVNRLQWTQRYFGLTAGDAVLQKTTFCFDVSVWELLWPVLAGARLVLAEPGGQVDSAYLAELMTMEGITMVHFVPSALQAFLEELPEGSLPGLKKVLCSGEELKPHHVFLFHKKLGGAELYNLYGPTEAAIDVTCWAATGDARTRTSIPIGRPVDNVTIHILDHNRQLVPVGIPGELYLGGIQVARGYLNRPELTEARFVADPFQPDGRLYRTGDLGRWLPDGNIEYLGRIDSQVKIRGFRIELGEIEAVIVGSGMVRQCVVLAQPDAFDGQQLVGYVVAGKGFKADALKTYLHGFLPDYMVPLVWINLDTLPLTANGKVDRRRLLELDTDRFVHKVYIPPHTEGEKSLASLWQSLLGVERVGREDSFFELGGHSLLATRLVSALRRELGVEVSIRSVFLYPRLEALAAHIGALNGGTNALLRGPRPEYIPLSFAQERLWFIDQLEGSIHYHIPFVLRLQGSLDVEALDYALRSIVARHEVLRTVIVKKDGVGYQRIAGAGEWQLQQSAWTGAEEGFREYVEQRIAVPFNLSRDYLLRAELVALNGEHVLILVLHHIAADGWSLPIVVAELTELYSSYRERRAPLLPELPVQYADYALWQRGYLKGAVLEEKLAYWKGQLTGVEHLDLPTDRPRPAVRSIRGGAVRSKMPENLLRGLERLSREQDTTLFMTMLAAFKVLLYKYSGQADICVGTPIAGRDRSEVEGLVGFFVNTLAVRSHVAGSPAFTDLLQAVRGTVLEAFEHQEVPFEQVVDAVVTERDLSRTPVFQVMFVMQNNEMATVDEASLGELLLQPEAVRPGTSIFELNLSVWPVEGEGLFLNLEYNTDLYEEATVQRLLEHYEVLLNAIVEAPGSSVGALNLLPVAERAQVLHDFNQTNHSIEYAGRLGDLLDASAKKHASETAIVFNETSLTYAELDHRSNQLARYLLEQGAVEQGVVGVCLERSLDLIVALVAIAKAGVGYVPLDPSYPSERLAYMASDSGVELIISNSHLHGSFATAFPSGIRILEIDRVEVELENYAADAVTRGPLQGVLGYLLYTSGSTGRPKGVEFPESALLNLLLWHQHKYGSANKKVLQFASIGFDASFQEIYSALCFGGTLCLVEEDQRKDMGYLLNTIEQNQITDLFLPYVVLRGLAEEARVQDRYPQSLSYIFTAGEQLRLHEDIEALQTNTGLRLLNYYGPSETHVVTAYEVQKEDYVDTELPPIGQPIWNTTIYILDNSGAPAPIGVPGEIYIGGVQVANGYRNQSTLTRERFVDQLIDGTVHRLYRTGDIGQWRSDGQVLFLGRRDEQVKIRGNRVELAEVEVVVEASGLVEQSVVMAPVDGRGYRNLICYVVPNKNYDQAQLQTFLRSLVPDYMVPAFIMELDALPLTTHGKVDKRALPAVDRLITAATYEAPATDTEKQLAEIWQSLLNIERVGRNDGFFELGGHSLLATRLVSALRKQLSVEVPIKAIFLNPRLHALAQYIDQLSGAALPALTPQERPFHIPLSFAQERLWFIDQLEGSVQYHIPFLLRLEGQLDTTALESAIRGVLERHEVLRTVIDKEEGGAYQRIVSAKGWRLQKTVWSGPAEGLDAYAAHAIAQPFSLSHDYLLRAELVTVDKAYVLILVLHHIVADGWSMPILVRELTELYRSHKEQSAAQLPELPIQYADYAIWQRQHLQGRALADKLAYWKAQLAHTEPLDLPTDHPRPSVPTVRGGAVQAKLPAALLQDLQRFSKQQDTTLFMTMLGAFKILLYKYSGQEDICVGTPIAGRQHKELEGLIGFFVNTLALRSQVNAASSFIDLLEDVRRTTLDAFEHQEAPFEQVVEAVVTERDLSRTPVFQVMFVMQNNETATVNEASLGELVLIPQPIRSRTSIFELNLSVWPVEGEGLFLNLEYGTDLYEQETVQRLLRHYEALLKAVLQSPRQRVDQLSLLGDEERRQLLYDFNQTDHAIGYSGRLGDLLDAAAKEHASETAVVFNNDSLTYAELDRRSNQLAHYLLEQGAAKQGVVGVCLERGFDLIVSLVAIAKAGIGYVPLDPSYPSERLAYMVSDSGVELVISSHTVQSILRNAISSDIKVLEIDRVEAELETHPADVIVRGPLEGSLGYLLYTSGSTGRPKGVEFPESALLNLLLWHQHNYGSANKKMLQFASIGFDASFQEIYSALCFGGTLCLVEEDQRKDMGYLLNTIEHNGITDLFLPYVVLRGLAEEARVQGRYPQSLSYIFTAGEQLRLHEDIEALQTNTGLRLLNYYGPSETHVVTAYEVQKEDYTDVELPPIGQPIWNTTIYILDGSGAPVPIGISGEIYIGGVQVANGYRNQPALTQERFVDKLVDGTTHRLYCTGDIGQWRSDGQVLFLGRRDEQVKIRGNRVELAEVEVTIEASGLVEQTVVLAPVDDRGYRNLICYVVPNSQYDRARLRTYLQAKVPDYMVPTVIIELESLPITAHGKVDKRALPAVGAMTATTAYEAPVTDTEKQLAGIWQSLLNVERAGRNDSFFELGGHSLLATRLVSALRKQLNAEVPIKAIFLNPRLQALAQYIDQLNGQELQTFTPITRPERLPLSFAQERLWFIDQLEGSVQYHIPFGLRIKGDLDVQALAYALRAIIKRHEVLRTVISREDGQGYQHIINADGWQLQRTQWKDADDRLHEYTQGLIEQPFDLLHDYPLRAELISVDEEYVLILVLHHIVADGWSLPILVRELTELYNSRKEQRTPLLPELPIQYADYALWQRHYLQGEVLEEKLAYWKEQLAGVEPLNLPTDHARPSVHTTRGGAAYLKLDTTLANRLDHLSKEQDTTLFMTLLAAFKVLLHKYSGQEDICVGTPIAGRQHKELEGLIGFFVNTLALRSQVNHASSFTDLLQNVRQTTLDAFEHQEVPFEQVVEAVVTERDLSRTPVFQVLFVMQNNEAATINEAGLGNLSLSYQPVRLDTSIFELNLSVWPVEGEGLFLNLEYNTDLYEGATVQRLLEHYEVLLNAIADAPGMPVGHLGLLTPTERAQVLHDFNQTNHSIEYAGRLGDLLDAVAKKHASETAVIFNDASLTYEELDRRSNQLAHYLLDQGAVKQGVVGVCLERSLDLIVSLVAIAKAGVGYVPLDPSYPAERLVYMASDSGVELIISNSHLHDSFATAFPSAIRILEIDAVGAELENYPADIVTRGPLESSLGYLLYTSGSTGRPKGVEFPESALLNLLLWHQHNYGSENKKVLQFASIGFDASFQEIYSALCFGGTLCLVEEDQRKDMGYLLNTIEHNEITDLFLPYVVLRGLAEEARVQDRYPKSLSYIFTAGEQLRLHEDIEALHVNTGLRLLNYYGPSETHVVTAYEAQKEDYIYTELPPIGTPIWNTTIYILDNSGAPAPIGVPGEIYIGGMQVANGYRNQPTLTQERFVDQLIDGTVHRLYRTGDIGQWRSDGQVLFLGRRDEQVKIRGNRVELAEVEVVVEASGLVEQSVVVAPVDGRGYRNLVCYVVPNGNYDRAQLRSYLQTQVPDYMVPTVIMELDSLPITAHGKVDKRALPAADHTAGTHEAVVTVLEQQLAGIWQSLLNIERVGRNDSFFELGGHSLLATRLVSALRKQLSVEVPIKDIFLNPRLAQQARYIEQQSGTIIPSLIRDGRTGSLPLSFAQERLWFIDRLEGSVQYHLPSVIRLEGALDLPALAYALRGIIDRHEVLRTLIREEGGRPYQQIVNDHDWQLSLESWPDARPDPLALKVHIEQIIDQPFDMSSDFMMRATLIRFGEEDHLLVLVMHHIVSDGWSVPIIVNELTELYRSYKEQRAPRLPELPVQYADYAIWQRNYLQGEVLDKKLDYWKEKLDGVEPLDLPTDFTRPLARSIQGGTIHTLLDKDLSTSIRRLSREQGTTLFMTMLTAFKVLLYKYSGQDDICVGTPTTGRDMGEVEGLIGFFINSLAVRSHLGGNPAFDALLSEVRATVLDAFSHQEVPFEKIVSESGVERDRARNPIFDVKFTVHNIPLSATLEAGEGLTLTAENYGTPTAVLDLSADIVEVGEEILVKFTYSADLFKEERMVRMLGHYRRLLAAVVAQPSAAIDTLPLLSEEETHQLLHTFNDSRRPYPLDQTILDYFTRQAAQTPDATALRYKGASISYQELDRRSTHLAQRLHALGLPRQRFVPVLTGRCPEGLIATLALWKAGAVYVPLDPALPAERLTLLLHDLDTDWLLTTTTALPTDFTPPAHTVLLDEPSLWQQADALQEQVFTPAQAHELAYCIYTSGSTGQPKAVQLEHLGLLHVCLDQVDTMHVGPNDRYLQFMSVAFDGALLDQFSTLISGAALVLPTADVLGSRAAFIEFVEEEGVTITTLTPSFLSVLEQHPLPSIHTLVTAGEAARYEDALFYSQRKHFYNGYGPSEVTVNATLCRVSPEGLEGRTTVPIGRPGANKQIYILGPGDSLSPIGVSGELCVSGIGLARGYWQRPELTAEKFVENPFKKGERLYRTGDVGRWLDDGNIEYLGRIDSQVKLRGYRIELGEIERVLEGGAGVQQAVVLVEGRGSAARLVGYVQGENVSSAEVLQEARQKLPAYMVPAQLRCLDRFPLTPNGKIDRNRLPSIEPEEEPVAAPETVAGETETLLLEIWKEVLELDSIGLNENFFDLGGHSLLAIRLISRIRETLGVELNIGDAFDHSTIAAMAAHIAARTAGDGVQKIEPQQRPARIPLSFAQERLWFIDQLEGSIQYHIPSVIRLRGALDVPALSAALKGIIARHEVLRTVIAREDGRPHQQIIDDHQWQLALETRDDQEPTALRQHIANLANRPFDMSRDFMIRATLIRFSEEDHLLVLVMHHIVSDGWSVPIIVNELTELYRSFREQGAPRLPELPVQYADYAIWQRNYLQGDVLDKKLDYWKEKLDGVEPLDLPTDFPRPLTHSIRGANDSFLLDADLTRSLKELARKQDATLFMTLLAAFKVLLYKYSGQEDICVGTPVAGRQHKEVEGLIGFFVNSLALRSHVPTDASFSTLLTGVRTTVLDAFGHQEAPFEKVVEAVVKERDLSRTPLFQVAFGLQNNEQGEIEEGSLGELELSPEHQEQNTSIYDLNLTLEEHGDRLRTGIEYNTDLYRRETINRLFAHYEQLLRSIVSAPNVSLKELDLLPSDERSQVEQLFPAQALQHTLDGRLLAALPSLTADSRLFILDAHQQPCPISIDGEVYVQTGTDNTLVPTGAIARWDEKGGIDYQGLRNDQVIVHGHRLFRSQIATLLEQSGLAARALVTLHPEAGLVAYIVPGEEGGFYRDGLISFLRSRVPEYAIPSVWIALEEVPLTRDGSIDYAALPDVEEGVQKQAFVAPGTDLEIQVAAIWKELLQVERRLSIHDNFFEMGGGSLLSMRLIAALRTALGVEVSVKEMFYYNTIAKLCEHLKQLEGTTNATDLPVLRKEERPARIPLSFAQERLWFIDQMEGSVQYHIPFVLRLQGELDQQALSFALKSIIDRHEVLRTVIDKEEGVGYQRILSSDDWQLSYTQWQSAPEDLRTYIEEQIALPFTLSQDYPIRAELIRIEEEHVLILVLHHLVSDGWSLPILVNELTELYRSHKEQRAALLPELPIQYADYAIWQRRYLQGELLDQKLGYWKEQLDDVQPLNLPTDHPRPFVHSVRGAMLSFTLDAALTDKIRELARQHDVTLFMALLAAFKVLLYRYSGQEDICVGSPIAGRQHREVEGLIGFFVNTLALRSRLDAADTFASLLQQVRRTTLDAFEHQDIPFEYVVKAIMGERDISKNPIFQVVFAMHQSDAGAIKEEGLGDVTLSHVHIDHTTSPFDMHVFLREDNGILHGGVEYCTDLYEEETMLRLIGHYRELLTSVTTDPAQPLLRLNLLTGDERETLLTTFNPAAFNTFGHTSIVAAWTEQAAKTPTAIALGFEHQSYTYRELDEHSTRLAHYLVHKGVRPGDLVPLLIGRSAALPLAILAVLKTGAAYVPIDPGYPAARIEYMLKDCAFTLMLGAGPGLEAMAGDATLVLLDRDAKAIAAAEPVTLPLPSANDAAYVMYTSGSTGIPKGVVISHANVVSLVRDADYVNLSTPHVLLATGSPSFDATTFEYWSMLLNGGRLLLCSETTLLDPDQLGHTIREEGVTMMWFTASLLNQLVETDPAVFATLKVVLAGGERLSPAHIGQLMTAYPQLQVINGYGPTENTSFSLTHNITTHDLERSIPIGRPLANRQAYILNREGQLNPIGIAGEICVGGAGLSAGYLNQPALTADRFVDHPFLPGARLYRTGDLGKWMADGAVHYLGRLDDQVKIRGHRIELGEIQEVMQQLADVSQAAVIVKEEEEALSKKILAFYVPEESAVRAREAELVDKQVETWRQLYDDQYDNAASAPNGDEEFNITGWNDSFTGQPIPAEDMKQWQDDIVDLVLRHQPRRVLEVGTGTGLIYYRIAPHIEHYTGTDFSAVSIGQVQSRIDRGDKPYPDTKLVQSFAHEVTVDADQKIDTVIINSVVQYFPSEQYLADVIDRCLTILDGHGRLIIGDVRDLRLLKLFKSRLSLARIDENTDIRAFSWNMDQEANREEELCIAPAFFFALQARYPQITQVNIEWKKGDYLNELSLYRYTVTLILDADATVRRPQWQPAPAQDLASVLDEGRSEIALSGVANPRLWQERLLTRAFAEKGIGRIRDLSAYAWQPDTDSHEALALLEAATGKGYSYRLFLNEDPLKMNVLLSKEAVAGAVMQDYRLSETPERYTNTPLFEDLTPLIMAGIAGELAQRLPDYMIPADFIAVDRLPLTRNGKTDRQLLADFSTVRTQGRAVSGEPRTETEQRVADIWRQLLKIDRIGISDNFFELGGHSLLATRLIAYIKKDFEIVISIRTLFQLKDLAELAAFIDSMKSDAPEADGNEFDVFEL